MPNLILDPFRGKLTTSPLTQRSSYPTLVPTLDFLLAPSIQQLVAKMMAAYKTFVSMSCTMRRLWSAKQTIRRQLIVAVAANTTHHRKMPYRSYRDSESCAGVPAAVARSRYSAELPA